MKLKGLTEDDLIRLVQANGGMIDNVPVMPSDSPIPSSAPAKPSKYRNQKIELEGFVFDSKKEARRWLDLREEQLAGTITELRRQVEFTLIVNGVTICTYVADFVYKRSGELVVEDVKSSATRKLRDYRIKIKLLEAIDGLKVQEI